ncbi:MAG TPA: replication-relaxation family protein, partial [Hyphomicrobiaceae bacterium]|nr:replication-relaxation family protein [Hyphomicrobiaceae bacterium]
MALETSVRGTYRPRRKRSDNPPPFQFTDRDLTILRAVARYRFLHSGHIRTLIPGSDKNLSNRLKGLFEHAYLDRPECQYDFYRPGGGSSPVVYALRDKGARILREHDGLEYGARVSWAHKNRRVGRPFLEHTLAISDFAVGLSVAVAASPVVDLRDGSALLARLPATTRDAAKPFRLSVPVIFKSTRHTIGIEPDYACSLGFPAAGRRAYFMVEIDRGTMPVERSDILQSSMLRKFLAYGAAWRSKIHTNVFGWRNFRVLVVTSNAERAQNMRDVLQTLTGGKGSA